MKIYTQVVDQDLREGREALADTVTVTIRSVAFSERKPMTDLEMTKLCAEAMGITGHSVREMNEMWSPEGWEKNKDAIVTNNSKWRIFNPFHDGEQVMELIKMFPVTCVDALDNAIEWGPKTEDGVRGTIDMNRIIVESVARMRAAK